MTKRELIDQIAVLNPTARPVFLADFNDRELAEYLEHLQWVVPNCEMQTDACVPVAATVESEADTRLAGGPLFPPPTLSAASA